MKLKSMLIPLGLSVFCGVVNAAPPATTVTPSIAYLDGDVNSSWVVDTLSDELTIGSTGVFFPNTHKTILTFDTTAVPGGQEIRDALVRLHYAVPNGTDYSGLAEYIEDNIKIEVAAPFGFGGSYTITGLDYYSLPLVTLAPEAFQIGFLGQPILDLTGHINLNGYTQVAISLINNPENIAINFISSDTDGGHPYYYNGQPTLEVSYK